MRSPQLLIVALASLKVTEEKMLVSAVGNVQDTGYYGNPDGESCPGPQGQKPFTFVWNSSRQGAICSLYGKPRRECPPAPVGTTAEVESNNLWCFLKCGKGNDCPEQMYCETLFHEFPICLFKKQGLPDNYGKPNRGPGPRCPNQQQSYGLHGTHGARYYTCSPYDCERDDQCPPPQPAIKAPAVCNAGYCFLACNEVSCPEGMECVDHAVHRNKVCAFKDDPTLVHP